MLYTLLKRFGPSVLPVSTKLTNLQTWLAFLAPLVNHRVKVIEMVVSNKAHMIAYSLILILVAYK